MDARDHGRDTELWLDEALSQYARIEPRPGLEGRVLARLAAEEVRADRTWRWWGAFAVSAAAVLALALVWFGRPQPKHTPETSAAKSGLETKTARATPRLMKPVVGGVGHRNTVAATRPSNTPKLEQFPSSVPLSDQEKMLALYVHDFPEKAALVARAQTDLRKQDELERDATSSVPQQ